MRLLACFTLLLSWSATYAQSKLMGFTDGNAARQTDLEKAFDAQLNPQNLDTWMKFMSSRPHHVGSPQGKANAEYMAALFRQWGYQAQISTYYVLFPTPKTRVLELLGSRPYRAKLEEPALAADNTSGQKAEQLPPYNAYSADGEVTAQLVFCKPGYPRGL